MLIGNNELRLNTSTMLAVVQEWLDRRLSEGIQAGPKVTGFSWDFDSEVFIVALLSKDKP